MWQLPVRFSLGPLLLTTALMVAMGVAGWRYADWAQAGSSAFALHMDEPPVTAGPLPEPSAPPATSPVPPDSRSNLAPPVNPVPLTAWTKGTGGPAAARTGGAPGDELITGGLFNWPLVAEVSSYYGPRWGRFHGGIDLAADMGDSIRAARAGEVILAGTVTDYGLTVIIRHPDQTSTLYAHCSRLLVTKGDQVKQGDTVALVGSTGRSTGPHLHFEIRVNDQARNPLDYLP